MSNAVKGHLWSRLVRTRSSVITVFPVAWLATGMRNGHYQRFFRAYFADHKIWEPLYDHLIPEHKLAAPAADKAIDRATVEERTEAVPRPLRRCH